MNWSEIKERFYHEDGSFRDIIADKDVMFLERWKLLCEFLQENYDVQMFCDVNEIGTFSYPLVEKAIFDEEHCYSASFSISDMLFILHLSFGNRHLELDIFPNEVDSLDKHYAILDFMTRVANVLQTRIMMTYENCPEGCLLEVEPAKTQE